MKLKQTVVVGIVGVLSTFGLLTLTSSAVGAAECGGVTTSIISCTEDNTGGSVENNGIWGLLLLTLRIMTAGVGVLAVGGIVYGAILYTSAGDRSEQVKKAISVITNVVIGLVAYVAMYALLEFLIPGGVFS